GPLRKASANPLSCVSVCADVRQIFQHNNTDILSSAVADDFSADLMINVLRMAPFSARDSCQQLPCRLRAVALKARSKCIVPLTPIPQARAAIECTSACGRENVLAQINSEDALSGRRDVGAQAHRHVKVPSFSTAQESCCVPHNSTTKI